MTFTPSANMEKVAINYHGRVYEPCLKNRHIISSQMKRFHIDSWIYVKTAD